MSFIQAGLLFLIGCVCGVLNSIAGGGGIIIFPTLILAGLPAITANATGTIISLPGHLVAAVAYRQELQREKSLCGLLISVGLLGGALGALLLLWLPANRFDQLVPYLLLVAMLLFSFNDTITARVLANSKETNPDQRKNWLKVAILQFIVAIYGGFYGLGISFLILATLQILGVKDIQLINGLKLLLISCIYSLATAIFIRSGIVAWEQGLVMMAGTIIGGYMGAKYARQLQPKLMKQLITIIGYSITCYFFMRP
ncbi:conserved membrane hypothetical protein [Planktothrix serta PCC 8927]|uniref:Probable membrane transporter protein n=1 Tax=Planktothrix serta PCC 8927 TaxID=671068 RepID=A0A7Z9BP50_9CYAN|nr:sulfite exporter TauE/SafE family protein [Planktothrix serta]VXD19413.1 conserved membrane hypothetical protein [Planktothrix serta PCC 8927]